MRAVKLEGAFLVSMLKSYHWIVASVFIFLSFFMVRGRFSLGSFSLKESTLESLGIEEREVILDALSRIENQKKYQVEVEKLTDLLKKETISVLVTDLNEQSRIKFSEGAELLFSKDFFSADPISQEIYLKNFFDDLAKNESFYQGTLAKLPTKPGYSSKGTKYK
jgi:hypothetical protein